MTRVEKLLARYSRRQLTQLGEVICSGVPGELIVVHTARCTRLDGQSCRCKPITLTLGASA